MVNRPYPQRPLPTGLQKGLKIASRMRPRFLKKDAVYFGDGEIPKDRLKRSLFAGTGLNPFSLP